MSNGMQAPSLYAQSDWMATGIGTAGTLLILPRIV